MLRLLIAVGWFASSGCGDHRAFTPRALPELVVAQPTDTPIAVPELMLVDGETMIWDVSAGGLTIARAELVVGEDEARSRFETNALASAFASVRHEHRTFLDRAAARPATATESLTIDGTIRQFDASFDAKSYMVGETRHAVASPAHTLHSAIGVLRAWARPEARAGHLLVVQGGVLYRIDLAQPAFADLHGTRAIRIDGRARSLDTTRDPIAVVIWISADDRRAVMRIEIQGGAQHLTAELVDAATV
ncbi:MAG: DUF3108 domain-containing protein [Deltaproteobacteria bacterium]|nr:DUF3108 domain-containing protein [Deltaproteobacteria bacterium]